MEVITMKLKSFFTRIIRSMRSSEIYISIVSEKMSKALIYILLIVCIIGSTSGLIQGLLTRSQLKDVIAVTKSDSFPNFSFSDGYFSIDRDEPIIYAYENYYKFIVDPTNTKNINDLAGYEAGYLLQPETLYISTIGHSPVRYDLTLLQGLEFNKNTLITYMETISIFIIPIVIIISIIFVLFSTFFKSLFLYILGIMMRNMNQIANLTNGGIYKMVLYSMTLGIILTEIISLILIITPIIRLSPWISSILPFLTFYLPSSFILSKGMKAYKDTNNNPPVTQ